MLPKLATEVTSRWRHPHTCMVQDPLVQLVEFTFQDSLYVLLHSHLGPSLHQLQPFQAEHPQGIGGQALLMIQDVNIWSAG